MSYFDEEGCSGLVTSQNCEGYWFVFAQHDTVAVSEGTLDRFEAEKWKRQLEKELSK